MRKYSKSRRGQKNYVIINSDDRIIKVADIVSEKQRKNRLKREYWAIKLAKSRNVNAPEIMSYYINEAGQEVLTTKKIVGKELTLSSLKVHQETMCKVGVQLSKLTSISSSFGWPNLVTLQGEYKSWNTFLCYFIEKYTVRLIAANIIDEKIYRQLLQLIKTYNFQLKDSSLLHGDIQAQNIILSNDRSVWLVDWENALLGDTAFDIAYFGARFGHITHWKNLASGAKVVVDSEKYILYEIIALLGLIDFYRYKQFNYNKQKKRLEKMIRLLNLS